MARQPAVLNADLNVSSVPSRTPGEVEQIVFKDYGRLRTVFVSGGNFAEDNSHAREILGELLEYRNVSIQGVLRYDSNGKMSLFIQDYAVEQKSGKK